MDAIKEFLRAADRLEHEEISIDEYEKLCEPLRDVRENAHGEWIAGKEIAREMIGERLLDIDYENYKCSACGLIIDRLLYCIDGSLFYKYCPNCGARMDGKKKR